MDQNKNNILLEKVIAALEACSFIAHPDCSKCYFDGPGLGFACRDQLMRSALALLKTQEPRVMTWEEAKASVNDGPFIIFEVRDSTGSELDFGVLVDDSYEMSEGSLLTVEFFPKMEEEYGKRFRMWTSRPTDEQRDATPWHS